MKILVLSDSHGALRLMRNAIEKLKPDTVIHLGDFYDDIMTVAEDYPQLVFHCVPGNCDQFRVRPDVPRTLCYPVGGVWLYMTHGHLQGVKSGLRRLTDEGRNSHAQAVLYGHTHCPDCHQEADGLWVLNPGSCGHSGGTVALIETNDGAISNCKLIAVADLEVMK